MKYQNGRRSQYLQQYAKSSLHSERQRLETPVSILNNNGQIPTNTSPTRMCNDSPNFKSYQLRNNLNDILFQGQRDELSRKSYSGKENRKSCSDGSQGILNEPSKSHFRSLTNCSDLGFFGIAQYENSNKQTQRMQNYSNRKPELLVIAHQDSEKEQAMQKYAKKLKKYKMPPRKREKLSTQVSRRSRRSNNKATSSKTSQKFIITDQIDDSFSSPQSGEELSCSYTSRAFSKKSGDITPVLVTKRDRFKKYLNDSIAPKKHQEYMQQQDLSVAIQFVDSPKMFDEYTDSQSFNQYKMGVNRSVCDFTKMDERSQIYSSQQNLRKHRFKSMDLENEQLEKQMNVNRSIGTMQIGLDVRSVKNKEPFQNLKPNVSQMQHKTYKEDDSVEAESSDEKDGRPATMKNGYGMDMNMFIFKSLEDNQSRHNELEQNQKQNFGILFNDYNPTTSLPSPINQLQPSQSQQISSKLSVASKMKSFTTSLPAQDESIESSAETPSKAQRKKRTPHENAKQCQDSNDESFFGASQAMVSNSKEGIDYSNSIVRPNGIKTSRYQIPRLALANIRESGHGRIIEQTELNFNSDEDMSEIRDELPQSYMLSKVLSSSRNSELGQSNQKTLRRFYETDTNMQTTSEAAGKIGEEMPTISEHEQKSSDSQDVPSMDDDDDEDDCLDSQPIQLSTTSAAAAAQQNHSRHITIKLYQ